MSEALWIVILRVYVLLFFVADCRTWMTMNITLYSLDEYMLAAAEKGTFGQKTWVCLDKSQILIEVQNNQMVVFLLLLSQFFYLYMISTWFIVFKGKLSI
jgi:hypothetical protein